MPVPIERPLSRKIRKGSEAKNVVVIPCSSESVPTAPVIVRMPTPSSLMSSTATHSRPSQCCAPVTAERYLGPQVRPLAHGASRRRPRKSPLCTCYCVGIAGHRAPRPLRLASSLLQRPRSLHGPSHAPGLPSKPTSKSILQLARRHGKCRLM